MSTKPRVSIVMGSDSDLDIMRESAKALEEFGIEYEIDVTSAHRSPERTAEFARKAAGARGPRDHCGRRGRGTLGGRYRRPHFVAGYRRADSVNLPARHGFIAGNRADAGRHSGGDGRHRQARSDQCGHSGGTDSGFRCEHRKSSRPTKKTGQQRGREIEKAEERAEDLGGAVSNTSVQPLQRT